MSESHVNHLWWLRLTGFLVTAYSPSELNRLLGRVCPEAVSSVPTGGSHADLAQAVAQAIEHRGLRLPLLRRMQEDLPGRRAEIRTLRQAWRASPRKRGARAPARRRGHTEQDMAGWFEGPNPYVGVSGRAARILYDRTDGLPVLVAATLQTWEQEGHITRVAPYRFRIALDSLEKLECEQYMRTPPTATLSAPPSGSGRGRAARLGLLQRPGRRGGRAGHRHGPLQRLDRRPRPAPAGGRLAARSGGAAGAPHPRPDRVDA